MNKKLVIMAGLLVAMVCHGLLAQEIVHMHASIPFDFRVGDKLIPAGRYLIQTSGSAVTLREETGRILAASFLTNAETRVSPAATGELVFNRYGSDYFLAIVWPPHSQLGRLLSMTPREKELTRLAGGGPVQAAVRAK